MTDVAVPSPQLAPGTIPGFATVPLPRTLFVPLGTSPRSAIEYAIRQGPVVRGGPLSSGNLDAGYTPVAPVAGTVVGTREIELTSGHTILAAEITVDADQPEPSPEETSPFDGNLAQVLERVAEQGVWADRKTTPDLIAQLHAALKRPIETVICNFLEADGAPLNSAILRSGAPLAVAGALALAKVLASRVQFVVDVEQYRPVSRALRKAKAAYAKIIELKNDYPQADPTILLYMLTGRRLRPGRLPVEQGVLMLDAAAALAVGQALVQRRAMTEIPLVIRERGHGRVHLASAPVGTPISHVLASLNIPITNVIIRAGAVLRDVQISPDAIVAGGENRFDVSPVTASADRAGGADPCIRCGWCVAACPTRIHPAGLLEAAQQNDQALAEFYGLPACIECGICSYVCPSRLPLLSAIRVLRNSTSTRP
ncbi:MAG TPA: 4Fe-4S dicluster domain-containing protein [Tepidisphaeraceae bacterium]|jgi:electron transport complex protein RnfC